MSREFVKRWGTTRRDPLEFGRAIDEVTRDLGEDLKTASREAQEILRMAYADAKRKEERLAEKIAEESL